MHDVVEMVRGVMARMSAASWELSLLLVSLLGEGGDAVALVGHLRLQIGQLFAMLRSLCLQRLPRRLTRAQPFPQRLL